jgi:hypothetical protein
MRYLVVVLAVLACVAQAAAKERVLAHLANPQVLQAPQGRSIALVWTLRAGPEPFSARGVYVRLRGLTTSTALGKELAPGRFRARLPIPRGGVRSIVIGLVGWRTDSRGSRRSDWRFPIDNDPTR